MFGWTVWLIRLVRILIGKQRLSRRSNERCCKMSNAWRINHLGFKIETLHRHFSRLFPIPNPAETMEISWSRLTYRGRSWCCSHQKLGCIKPKEFECTEAGYLENFGARFGMGEIEGDRNLGWFLLGICVVEAGLLGAFFFFPMAGVFCCCFVLVVEAQGRSFVTWCLFVRIQKLCEYEEDQRDI